ncbi:holin [Marinococcus halophilus]|uniref:holin n=1 Tax=Marinococcus halophilus TaxID=1371 RepID=UPI0015C4AC0F|nr:holin [Marinococcus halophilus]
MEISTEFLLYMSFIGGVSTALMQLLKNALTLPKKYVPLLTLGLGVLLALIPFPFVDVALAERIWAGALSGLGGTGIFEAIRQDKQGKTKETKAVG